MRAIALAFIGLMTLGLISCHARGVKGNGNIITKEINVSDFTEIRIGQGIGSSGINGLFSWGQKFKSPVFNYSQQKGNAGLEIKIDENLLSALKIESTDGILMIEAKKGSQISPTTLEINGHSSGLTKLSTSGSTDFYLKSDLTTDNLEISSSGGSDVYLKNPVRISGLCKFSLSGGSDLKATDLECDEIEVRTSGGSDISLAGNANSGLYRSSGGSDINAYNLVVKSLDCASSGGSDIETTVTESLDASASGGSDIRYKGNPKVNKSASGGSDIDHVN